MLKRWRNSLSRLGIGGRKFALRKSVVNYGDFAALDFGMELLRDGA